jgi:peptidyl-prolyl cis-trans isomerase SurA
MKKFLLITLMAAGCLAATARAEQVAGIAAVVNDDAISMTDLRERMKLVLASSGLPNNEEVRARILPQVVESLIEEQLKLQEARRNKLEVSDEEVAEGFKIIATQNKYEPEQFAGLMKKAGISLDTLNDQIRAQLSWNKYIKEVLRKRVNVSDSEVQTRTERMKAKIGQTEYLAAEIYLPIENPKQAGQVQQFAQKMANELQAKKAPFGPVAVQFSKAAGAEKGGTLGWIQQGQLQPELEKTLFALEEGGVSNPIRLTDGIHILNLQKKRTITEDSIPKADEMANMIGFERLDRAQQRALLDLKSAAFIDRRV